MSSKALEEEIWQWLAAVPQGKVASYGQLARLSGYPSHSRFVGRTLRQLPSGTSLPWFRVLRASGELAFAAHSAPWSRQKKLLEEDGIILTKGKVNMRHYQWDL